MTQAQLTQARGWAQRMLSEVPAVIIDTETTAIDGSIIEIAVVDASSGRILLDTYVNPDGVAISAGAQAVHGITSDDIASAPRWPDVFAELQAVTAGSVALAYNADFDRGRIVHDCGRAGLRPGQLAEADAWACVMQWRSAALGTSKSLALGGGHRALGDVQATRVLLQQMAAGTLELHR